MEIKKVCRMKKKSEKVCGIVNKLLLLHPLSRQKIGFSVLRRAGEERKARSSLKDFRDRASSADARSGDAFRKEEAS